MTNLKWLISIGIWLSSVGIAYYKGRNDGVASVKLEVNQSTITTQNKDIAKANSDKQTDNYYTTYARQQLQELMLKPRVVIVESNCPALADVREQFNNVYRD